MALDVARVLVQGRDRVHDQWGSDGQDRQDPRRLAAERTVPTDTAAVVDRLEADVRTLRKFVAS